MHLIEKKIVNSKSSLPYLIYFWYRELDIIRKILYPTLFAVFYAGSVLFAITAYWIKTDLDYNMFSHGGWHAYAKCIIHEVNSDRRLQARLNAAKTDKQAVKRKEATPFN
jgi:hypothetical protein